MQKKALHTLGNHAEGDFFTQKRETNIMSNERISYKVIANVRTLAEHLTSRSKEKPKFLR